MATWKSAGKVRMTPKGIWDSSSTYEVLDLVSNTNKSIFYIAKQDVPVNIALTNENYWVVVLDATIGIRAKAPELVANYIQEFGPRQAFNIFVNMAINDGVSLNDAVTLFYSNAKTGKIYGVEFYRFNVSPSSIGTKTHDNANMVCEPSTNTVAGRDDYANLALFMPININYKWSDTTNLEPTITEIEGITDGFSLSNPNGLVGVLQMGAWVNIWSDGTKKYRLYSDTQLNNGYEPLPECVRAKDNSFRPWMIHAKYVAGLNASGKLTSASGLFPVSRSTGSRVNKTISHDNQIPLWRQLGTAYSGQSIQDRVFLELMFEVKYARLGNSDLISGCANYDIVKRVAVGETNVKRVLLTETDGEPYYVGSTISVGTENGRHLAGGHNIVDRYRIVEKTNVTIDNTTYVALQIDTPTVFTTEVGQYVLTEPWFSGSCDDIRGNDGSPYNLTDKKNPAKIQGIEFMVGISEIIADTVLQNTGEGYYNVIINRKAIDLQAGGVGDNAYTANETIGMAEESGYNYIQEMGESIDSLIIPTSTGGTASSGNGYRAACYTEAVNSSSGYREWLASGYIGAVNLAGVPLVYCQYELGYSSVYTSTRAAGSSGNRGEWGATLN